MATQKRFNKLLVSTLVLAAGTFVAGIAFVSLQLAMFTAGFLGSIGFVAGDIRRRRFWENAISFKMQTIEKDHNTLNQKIVRTRQDVMTLRQTIAEKAVRMERYEERLEEFELGGTSRGSHSSKPTPLMQRQPEPRYADAADALRASKPGQEQHHANDDEINELSDTVIKELIHHAVRNKQIDVFVQPIVRLPQRKVRFYEIFARVRARPGLYIPASRYMALAQKEKRSNEIDVLILNECLDTILNSAHVERAAPLFLNITSNTLKNMDFMKRLLSFLSNYRHLAPRIVLEIPHAHYKSLQPALKEILRGLGKLGCSLSLDDAETLTLDIAELQRMHMRFIKIEAKTLMPFTRNEKQRADLSRQKRKLESNGIGVIVEKIETENALVELLDFDIHYGQGYLFGRPDLEAAYRKKKAA